MTHALAGETHAENASKDKQDGASRLGPKLLRLIGCEECLDEIHHAVANVRHQKQDENPAEDVRIGEVGGIPIIDMISELTRNLPSEPRGRDKQ